MPTRIDSRQVTHAGSIDQIASSTSTELDNLLASISADLTPPLRLLAQSPASRVVTIQAETLANPETGRNRSIPPINSVIPTFSTDTVTFPAASGGAITGSSLATAYTLTVAAGQYIKVGFSLDSTGKIVLTFGIASTTGLLSEATAPTTVSGTYPIGFVVIRNISGAIQNVASSAIYQFYGALAGATDLHSAVTAGLITFNPQTIYGNKTFNAQLDVGSAGATTGRFSVEQDAGDTINTGIGLIRNSGSGISAKLWIDSSDVLTLSRNNTTVATVSGPGAWAVGPGGIAAQTVLTINGNGTSGVNLLQAGTSYAAVISNEHGTGRTVFASNAKSASTAAVNYGKITAGSGATAIALGISDVDTNMAVTIAYSPSGNTSGNFSSFFQYQLASCTPHGEWTLGSPETGNSHTVHGEFLKLVVGANKPQDATIVMTPGSTSGTSAAVFRADILEGNDTVNSAPVMSFAVRRTTPTPAPVSVRPLFRWINNTTTVAEINASSQFSVRDGSADAPTFSFRSYLKTGIYASSINTLGISTEGFLRFSVSPTQLTSTLPYSGTSISLSSTLQATGRINGAGRFTGPFGTPLLPSYALGTNDLGMFSPVAGSVAFSSITEMARFTSSGLCFNGDTSSTFRWKYLTGVVLANNTSGDLNPGVTISGVTISGVFGWDVTTNQPIGTDQGTSASITGMYFTAAGSANRIRIQNDSPANRTYRLVIFY